jgi:hypothetical protein
MGFSDYLLDHKLVTKEGMSQALKIQQRTRPPLGQLAIDRGWLTRQNIFTIVTEQANPKTKGNRFGEIAIALGFLAEAQVSDLVMAQNHPSTFIGEILISKGMLTKKQLIRALWEYNQVLKAC